MRKFTFTLSSICVIHKHKRLEIDTGYLPTKLTAVLGYMYN